MRSLTLNMALGCLLVSANAAVVQAQGNETKAKASNSTSKPKTLWAEKKAVVQDVKQLEILEANLQEQMGNITLDNLLAQALKDNPDIRVAEAKMREAEAELNRVKLQVTQKVVAQQREIAACKAALKMAQAFYDRTLALGQVGAVSKEVLDDVEAKLQKAKADLARVETELSYILGSPPTVRRRASLELLDALRRRSEAALPKGNSPTEQARLKEQMEKAQRQLEEFMKLEMEQGRRQELQNKEKAKTAGETIDFFPPALATIVRASERHASLPPAMADKIRKALDTPVKVDFSQATPKDILDFLQEHTKGFNLVDQVHIDKAAPVTLRLTEPVPVGAVFQFLEDQYNWRFVIREYGIVVAQAGSMPPGAVNLHTFWKERPPQALTLPAGTQNK